MSFAIIQTGGKQYKVKASEIIKIEQLETLKTQNKIEFNEVLAYGDEKTMEIGSPLVKGAKVEAELVKNGKNKTVLIFKKKRRKNSRKKNGHRQLYSLIKIKKIFSKDGSLLAEAKKLEKKEIKKTEKKETIVKEK
jgi:ribosomal protein L21